ncbi:hypothetical protein [Paenibacillus sp. YYML68]|uniref:hypothetical protein n=1 Tax=Paenibacillus sp. YYML68 TaxID=2909250 RepID=UPI002491F299|nr:hypothetical protein [Paenibacillus sp. YYML68]
MPFTTGLVTNTRDFGTAATNIVINARNISSVNAATVLVQIFGSTDSSALVPLYQTAYPIAPNSFHIREFFIAGNVSYEVQLNVSGTTPQNVIMSIYGLDEFGNLVTDQRFAQSELTQVQTLSPI